VTADAQELDEAGTPLIGKKTADARFLLSDESLSPEIRNALLNAEPGATRTAKFESQHGDHHHTVHLALRVTKVEKVALPPFDDTLVTKITGGKVTSAAEFTASLRADITKYWDDQATGTLNDNIARAIVDAHDFKVPGALVEGLLDSFVEDVKQRSRDRKLPRGFDEKKFREESHPHAEWQAKWMLLKESIAATEKLEVTDAEIEELATTESARMGIDRERILQFYKNSGGATDRLLSDKIMQFLRTNANVTDTPDDAHQHS
jgi:FKBP-type peptidyl-prolyl cis-trans isomerase (trigger factor)